MARRPVSRLPVDARRRRPRAVRRHLRWFEPPRLRLPHRAGPDRPRPGHPAVHAHDVDRRHDLRLARRRADRAVWFGAAAGRARTGERVHRPARRSARGVSLPPAAVGSAPVGARAAAATSPARAASAGRHLVRPRRRCRPRRSPRDQGRRCRSRGRHRGQELPPGDPVGTDGDPHRLARRPRSGRCRGGSSARRREGLDDALPGPPCRGRCGPRSGAPGTGAWGLAGRGQLDRGHGGAHRRRLPGR